jgi:hypothetical protein
MADNTASLVVALSAQLSKFESDMKKAGIIADQSVNDIENKFSRMAPTISSSFFGNLFSNLTTRGIDAATKAVADLVNRFVELQKVAEYTDTSMQWIYGLQTALHQTGASVEEVNTAFKAVAASLDELQRGGDNALKTLFAAPGNQQFLKGFNKDAATAEETFTRVLKIIGEMPNMIRAVDVGKNLGIPASVAAAAWKEGGDALDAMAKKAAAAAPNLEDAANATAKLSAAWSAFTKDLGSDWASKALVGFQKLAAVALAITEWEQSLFHGGPLEAASARELARWQEINRILNETKTSTATGGLTRVKVTGGTAEDPFAHHDAAAAAGAYERETNAINKQIATMQAENATLGESAHAQEEYRVQLILSEKAAQDGKEFTAALNDEIAVTAERAATAKQQLAEHTFALQRLNSASQQVGSALSTAFADAIVEGKSLNDVMSSLIKTLEKAAINTLVMSLFTPGAGGTLAPVLSLGGIGHAAGGTNFAPGGLMMVGEQGPELVNLPRGSQVIPNDVARSMSGSSGAIVYSPAIDARGASVEAVARLAQIMEADRATFASRTVATIQSARRGRVPGL